MPQREFRFSDVSRKDLNTEGEPEIGRAQMMVRVTIIAPAGSNADDFPASLEIIEDEVQSGETVHTDSKYRLVLLAAKRSKQLNAQSALIGDSGSTTVSKDLPQFSATEAQHEDNVPGMPRALASWFRPLPYFIQIRIYMFR